MQEGRKKKKKDPFEENDLGKRFKMLKEQLAEEESNEQEGIM